MAIRIPKLIKIEISQTEKEFGHFQLSKVFRGWCDDYLQEFFDYFSQNLENNRRKTQIIRYSLIILLGKQKIRHYFNHWRIQNSILRYKNKKSKHPKQIMVDPNSKYSKFNENIDLLSATPKTQKSVRLHKAIQIVLTKGFNIFGNITEKSVEEEKTMVFLPEFEVRMSQKYKRFVPPYTPTTKPKIQKLGKFVDTKLLVNFYKFSSHTVPYERIMQNAENKIQLSRFIRIFNQHIQLQKHSFWVKLRSDVSMQEMEKSSRKVKSLSLALSPLKLKNLGCVKTYTIYKWLTDKKIGKAFDIWKMKVLAMILLKVHSSNRHTFEAYSNIFIYIYYTDYL